VTRPPRIRGPFFQHEMLRILTVPQVNCFDRLNQNAAFSCSDGAKNVHGMTPTSRSQGTEGPSAHFGSASVHSSSLPLPLLLPQPLIPITRNIPHIRHGMRSYQFCTENLLRRSRRQLSANGAIAASRVASTRHSADR
jgi:hypothetical protein